jgi:large subunit ribosomal protein L10
LRLERKVAKSFLVYKVEKINFIQIKGAKKMSTKAFKQDKVSLIKEKIDKAQVAIVTEYKGYSVEEITNLRRALQKEGGDYMVTKNTLAKLAVKDTPYEVLTETFKGPIALAFGFGDQVAPAKALSKFIKDTKKGEIIAAAMDGKLLSADEAKALATIPSKEEIYAKMLGCVNSPATGIVGSINAVMASLTRAVAAVRDQKSA